MFDMTLIVRIILLAAFALLSDGHNIETRSHTLVKPTSMNTQFGTSFAVRKISSDTYLYIGAPSSGTPDSNRVSPGDLYICGLKGNEQGIFYCSTVAPFSLKGAIGLSVATPEAFNSLVTCGSQYTKVCAGANIEQRSMGVCYRSNVFLGSTVVLNNPAPQECPGNASSGLDIVFVVDKSGSIGSLNFELALQWMVDVLSGYKSEINSGIVRVGMVSYSSLVFNEFNLAQYTYTQLEAMITDVRYTGGDTRTDLGLQNARVMMNVLKRAAASAMLIVVTDGKSSSNSKTLSQATLTRRAGITIVAVGIANFDETELVEIAGDPEQVITVLSFNQLSTIVGTLQKVINETGQGNLEGVGDGNTTNEFSQCQLGFSAHYTAGSNLYVGAVGSFDRTGSLASYSPSSVAYSSLLANSDLNSVFNATDHRESYVGYSVSSGYFFGLFGGEFVASGAPRYESRGTVLIMSGSAFSNPSTSFSVHPSGETWQLGAYFGQTVMGMDLNEDTLDDLLVSAPLFFSQGGYDQGRVFVFMNDPKNIGPRNWMNSSFQPIILSGHASGGRFGSTISTPGDLDRNGYADVIIGAPTEEENADNSGAVYIYYLSSNGISDAHRQRILGSAFFSPLRRFGASAAYSNRFGNDFNNDGYPDVYVGAPSSDSVVVLRSRPIIEVTSSLTLSPSEIDVISCVSSSNAVCSTASFCISAVFRTNPESENFAFRITGVLDSLIADLFFKRLLVLGKDSHEQIITSQNINNVQQCFTLQMRPNVRTFGKLGAGGGGFQIIPRVNFSYDLTPEEKAPHLSPVLDRFVNQYKVADWSFRTGCKGLGGICEHDLLAVAKYSLDSSNEDLILNSLVGIVSVTISIRNAGPDHSYFTKINVTSGSLPRSRVIGDCVRLSAADSTPGFTVLEYVGSSTALEDLMLINAQCEFTIEFDLGSMTSKAVDDLIQIQGIVYSNAGSLLSEINSENNKFTFQRLVAYSASLIFGSSASPDELFYNRTVAPGTNISNLDDPLLGGSITNVVHTHIITSTGPLMIAAAPLKFTWPGALDFLPLLYLYKFNCQPAEYCSCNTEGKVNSLGLAVDRNTQGNNVELKFPSLNQVQLPSELTCDDVTCGTISCTLKNMTSHAKVEVTASFKVWIPTLAQPNLNTKMFSDITVDTTPLPIEPAGQIYVRRASTTVRTYLPPDPNPIQGGETDIGAIIGGVLGGIALLCIIVLVLWKVGFFKSKYGDMTREAREMEGGDEASPYELAG